MTMKKQGKETSCVYSNSYVPSICREPIKIALMVLEIAPPGTERKLTSRPSAWPMTDAHRTFIYYRFLCRSMTRFFFTLRISFF